MLILLAVISVVSMMQVFMRYFMHSALSWPEELCRFCFAELSIDHLEKCSTSL